MTTRARHRNSYLEFYDSRTHETFPIGAPINFKEDFIGYQLVQSEAGSTAQWLTVQVALNTAMATIDEGHGGVLSMAFDADANAEDAVIYTGDIRQFDLNKDIQFECRARLSVVPTLTSQVVIGMAGDHNLDKDAVTEAAWFKFDGAALAAVETDDTTNNNDDVSTGITVTTAAWHIYKIDFSDLTNVRFFIDGAQVATGTTFDMSNLTAAEAYMQPYISLDKGADAGLGTLLVDYVKVWGGR